MRWERERLTVHETVTAAPPMPDSDVILEHEEQVFDSVPEIAGDGKHWVLFRDIKGTIEVPSEASEFIVWASNQNERVRRRDAEGKFISDDPDTENDEAWETIPVQRPADAPVRKFAGDT